MIRVGFAASCSSNDCDVLTKDYAAGGGGGFGMRGACRTSAVSCSGGIPMLIVTVTLPPIATPPPHDQFVPA
jgi:hypothetical protein